MSCPEEEGHIWEIIIIIKNIGRAIVLGLSCGVGKGGRRMKGIEIALFIIGCGVKLAEIIAEED